MLSLTLSQIQFKARLGSLFSPYRLKTPLTISSRELMRTLKLFKVEQQMIAFIVCLSEDPNVCIQVNRKNIQQGSAANFLHAYTEHRLYLDELGKSRQDAILLHLRNNYFKKTQLIYLLKNLSNDGISYFLLASECFDKTELLEICNDFTIVSSLNSEILKEFYHYFNKHRRWQVSETPLLDMHYFAYRAGHVLGLSEPIAVSIGDKTYHLKTEYAPTEVSIKILYEHLQAYANANYSELFETITIAVKENWQLHRKNQSSYIEDAELQILQQYKNKELTFICCGWLCHTVTVVLYGNYLIYTNRGPYGDPRYGSKIFAINDPTAITKDWIKDLISNQSAENFNNVLKRVINFKKPIARFHSKPQNHANCTLANPKSSIEPILILLKAGLQANTADVQRAAYQERHRKKYKHFTEMMRNREIDELVKNMFYAKHSDLIKFYANLVKEIIRVHHGKDNLTTKDKKERVRAIDLFSRTPDKIQEIIRKDLDWMENFQEICDKEEIVLPPPGILFYQKHNVLNHKSNRSHTVLTEQGYIVEIDGVETPKMTFNFKNTRKLCSQVLKSW